MSQPIPLPPPLKAEELRVERKQISPSEVESYYVRRSTGERVTTLGVTYMHMTPEQAANLDPPPVEDPLD